MSRLEILGDKIFKPFIGEARIAEAVSRLATEINRDLSGKSPVFIAVLNGSFMFASDLLKQINIPCEVAFVKMRSYGGSASSGLVTELIGLEQDIDGRCVVILEDIVDSGLTLWKLNGILQEKKAGEIRVATLLFKPDAFKEGRVPDYIGIRIGNEFVVGYGMDYCGLGRNLNEIHVLA